MSPAFDSLASRARQRLKELKYAPVETMARWLIAKNRQAEWVHRYHTWKRSFYAEQNKQLRGILSGHLHPRSVIVFTPSLNWEGQLFQRPQQMALALAKRGALVFYTQLEPLARGAAIQAVSDGLYVCALPLELFSNVERLFAYSLTWNRKYLLKLPAARILYDYLDAISAFEGDPAQLARDHAALLDGADIVVATARQLHEEATRVRPDALYAPNGVDFAHFQPGKEIATPPDIARLRQDGKPVIGYFGALAHWFDYALMTDLAAERSDFHFVLIGPRHDRSLEESGLLRQTNVHYLGPRTYAELPAYLASFDAAILPFKVNTITQSTSPIKLFEYFAGGKPVVSTPLREVTQYPEVCTGRDAAEFSRQIDAALALRGDPTFVRQLLEIARENTWETRAERILQAMERVESHS